MALPSQSSRPSTATRSFGTRPRARSIPRPILLASIAGLAVVALGWWALSGTAEVPQPGDSLRLASEVPAPSPKAADPKPDAPRLEPKAEQPKEAAPPPPLEIGQGRLAAGNTAPPPTLTSLVTAPGTAPATTPNSAPPAGPGTKPAAPAPPAADAVGTRSRLSRLILDPTTPEADRARMRDEVAKINDELVFSPRVAAGDPFTTIYAVQSGDALERIARKTHAAGHWRLIQRINGLANPNRIQLNQKLKVVTGPFHAVVNKAAFRMDIFMGDAAVPAGWVFVRSFPVGLGKGGGTPIGKFVVKRNSKLENPYWVNPRTGEQFGKDDPKNPIGERWIGLEGVGESAAHTSYGIHGTIDPDSIGREESMGCIRLNGPDVEWVYDMLSEGVSVVEIRP
ncbi:MAG: L,D-transpeptidase family protein [Phycisphaerales bacterium]|nr:L,D-transpeptidase family protein [Phycisphaerales bacterium]